MIRENLYEKMWSHLKIKTLNTKGKTIAKTKANALKQRKNSDQKRKRKKQWKTL